MTWQQYGEAAYNKIQKAVSGPDLVPDYVPDFTRCVNHFAIHAGRPHFELSCLLCRLIKNDPVAESVVTGFHVSSSLDHAPKISSCHPELHIAAPSPTSHSFFPHPHLHPNSHTSSHLLGGYAVLKGIQQRLSLPTNRMIASYATLGEYGNTSCSTTVSTSA